MKYAIYGANRIAKDFMYIFDELEIVCFFDDVVTVDFLGRKVYLIEKISNYVDKYDKIIICDNNKTQKTKKLKELGQKYEEDFLYEEDFFSSLDNWSMPINRKIAIWGNGRVGTRFIKEHSELSINVIIDTSGKETAILPENIMEWSDYFVIITVTNYHEIEAYLTAMNLKKYVDFVTYSDYEMKPSCLLRKTIFDEACYDFECDTMHNHLEILGGGNTSCCCTAFVSVRLGSVVEKGVDGIWDSLAHKILCLSTENKTYSFCDKSMCPFFIGESKQSKLDLLKPYKEIQKKPSVVALGYDKLCNLKCSTCRNDYYKDTLLDCELKEKIVDVVEKELMDNCKFLIAAGDGEVFLSKYYKKIYTNPKIKNVSYVRFLSNGMLFTPNKWDEIRKRIRGKIMLTISIDAATKETYEKIRCGGNFEILKKNLEFASKLRENGGLSYLRINFVVQKENYKEMIPFVNWGLKLGCDEIFFTKILNWGTYSKEKFQEISMMEEDGITPKKELLEILKNPILQNTKVDLGTIQYGHSVVYDRKIENYYMWELQRRVSDLFDDKEEIK